MDHKGWVGRVIAVLVALFLVYFWTQPSFAPAPHVRKKVRFWHMWTAEWKDVVDKIVDRYNKSQNEYEVEALSVPTAGADSKFVLGVLGGDPPDVMAQWNPVIPSWAEAHMLTPFDELMSPEEKRIFDTQAYPVVKKVGSYKGRVYGVSIGINMFALYYLPDQLKEAGLDPNKPPTTLEELDAMGAKLNQFDKKGNLTRLGWMPSNIQMYAPIFGGGFYDWSKDKLTLDTPQNRAALEYIAHSQKRLGYDNVSRYNSGLNTASFSGGWPFIGGAYSFTLDGQWRVEQIGKYAPKLHYATAMVPPPKGGKPMAGVSGGNFMVVPTGAKNKKGAWEFIKFWSGLTHPEVAAEFYTWGGWLPLTPAIAEAPAYQAYIRKYPQFKTFVDLMPSTNIDVLPPVPYQTFLSDHIGSMEETAARGTVPPVQALKDLQATLDAEIRRRKELGYAQ